MESKQAQDSQSPFIPMFESFRAELDEHHDRRERIVKASRDITAASKKLIFALQRVRTLGKPVTIHTSKATSPHVNTINENFRKVAPDLQGINFFRYQRNISGGTQEWMEAVSFQHYLETQRLITLNEATKELQALIGPGIDLIITPADYILGLFDMTGELMRFAITAMATLGALPSTVIDGGQADSEDDSDKKSQHRNVLNDLQALRAKLETLDVGFYGYDKKLDVTQASVEKVEKALYGLVVRGSERPKGWVPDLSDSRSGPEETEVY